MKDKIHHILEATFKECIEKKLLHLEEIPEVIVEKPTIASHGDFSSNVALVLASRLKQKPRAIAELLTQNLKDPQGYVVKTEIAGPGFINFFLSPKAYHDGLRTILAQGARFGLAAPRAEKILIEYVSANPTGPMHIGHGRNAVVGDTLARLLKACGYEVSKEFYVNDHGVQIRTLGNSVLYYLQKLQNPGKEIPPPPADSYQGAYLEELVIKHQENLKKMPEDPLIVGKTMGKELLEQIKEDLAELRIEFDHFFLESSLYESGEIEKVLHELKEEGYLFEQEGAKWFRSTTFGDDKDRVLVKKEGSYTYFTPDIAYHRNKYERHYSLYLNIWGADHAGYIPRVKAAMEALGYDPNRLKVVFMQMVNLKRGGERVQMSKRAGTYVTLEEVVEEVGADAARFFFLMRSANAQLDFDLDLAKKQSPDNPVYYIQYAHARIASIFRKAKEAGVLKEAKVGFSEKESVDYLELPEEFDLIERLSMYPEVLREAGENFEPHRVAFYLLDLAKAFQTYYSRAKGDERYRVISPDLQKTKSKLLLIHALQSVLQSGFEIVGVNAPEYMSLEGNEES